MNYKVFTFSFRVDAAGTQGQAVSLDSGFFAMGAGFNWIPDTYGERFQVTTSAPVAGWSGETGTGWEIAGRFNGTGTLQFYVCGVDGLAAGPDGHITQGLGSPWVASPDSPWMSSPDSPAPLSQEV